MHWLAHRQAPDQCCGGLAGCLGLMPALPILPCCLRGHPTGPHTAWRPGLRAVLLSAGIDLDDARRKREDNIVQLRKDRRDESLQKKRMVSAVVAEGGELESNRAGQAVQQKVRRRQRGGWACQLARPQLSRVPQLRACTRGQGSRRRSLLLPRRFLPPQPWSHLPGPPPAHPPPLAAGEPARHGARRVVRGQPGTAGGHHAVPQAAVHRWVLQQAGRACSHAPARRNLGAQNGPPAAAGNCTVQPTAAGPLLSRPLLTRSSRRPTSPAPLPQSATLPSRR